MNAIIAQIVTFIINLIRDAAKKLRLNSLLKTADKAKETSDAQTNSSIQSYDEFMGDYHDFLESVGPDMPGEPANVQKPTKPRRRKPTRTAGNNKRPTGNNKRTGSRNRRAKQTIKRGKK